MQTIISLDTVKDGQLMEQIQSAFREIIADIKSEEKDAQHRRQVTIKLNFDPTPDRAAVKMTAEIKSVLGRHNQIGAMLFFEKKGKEIIAHDEDPAQGKLVG